MSLSALRRCTMSHYKNFVAKTTTYFRPTLNSTLEADRFTRFRVKKEKERSMLIALEKIDYLLDSLTIEILSRQSVQDLLQFKSVCKSWHAIISSPNFVTKHLKNYYKNNDDWRGCLFAQSYISHAEIQLYELLLDETPRVIADEVLYDMPMYCSYVYGPCDGLYYLYHHLCENGRALWNPATNELKTLPKIICKPGFTYGRNEVYGFGFDHVSGDYKVVVMTSYRNTNDDSDDSDLQHPGSVFVYSLRTDSWKYCGDLAKAYDLEKNKCYIYVNGCCYWLGSLDYYSSEVIISFDMTNDSFKEIDVPDYSKPSYKCLAVYDDSLVFLSIHETEKNFDIWTWSEGCWTKKFTLGPLPNVWSPVGHWKGNSLVLQCNSRVLQCSGGFKLVLFDPDTQETKDLEFELPMGCEGVFAYMESLVSIKGKMYSSMRKTES